MSSANLVYGSRFPFLGLRISRVGVVDSGSMARQAIGSCLASLFEQVYRNMANIVVRNAHLLGLPGVAKPNTSDLHVCSRDSIWYMAQFSRSSSANVVSNRSAKKADKPSAARQDPGSHRSRGGFVEVEMPRTTMLHGTENWKVRPSPGERG